MIQTIKTLLFAILLSPLGTHAGGSYIPGSTYANPAPETTAQYRNKPCADPWVGIALVRVYGAADPALCATGLYNGGQWRDFNELVHAVEATRVSNQRQSLALRLMPIQGTNKLAIAVFQGSRMVAAGGGNLVAAGGGNIVAAGAGNVLVNNGGNLVAAGGGNFVGNAGGNALPVAETTAASFGLQSGTSVKLPKGSLKFQ
ncbi:MAG: hypothetical protein V4650_10180 [Pseudomonadota bacterium]